MNFKVNCKNGTQNIAVHKTLLVFVVLLFSLWNIGWNRDEANLIELSSPRPDSPSSAPDVVKISPELNQQLDALYEKMRQSVDAANPDGLEYGALLLEMDLPTGTTGREYIQVGQVQRGKNQYIQGTSIVESVHIDENQDADIESEGDPMGRVHTHPLNGPCPSPMDLVIALRASYEIVVSGEQRALVLRTKQTPQIESLEGTPWDRTLTPMMARKFSAKDYKEGKPMYISTWYQYTLDKLLGGNMLLDKLLNGDTVSFEENKVDPPYLRWFGGLEDRSKDDPSTKMVADYLNLAYYRGTGTTLYRVPCDGAAAPLIAHMDQEYKDFKERCVKVLRDKKIEFVDPVEDCLGRGK